MQLEKYEIQSAKSLLSFEFYSIGPNGKVKKQVKFQSFEHNRNVFNIVFGDLDESGKINDLTITGNKDSQKVLATVALIIFNFLITHPDSFVLAIGSTDSRTRLYRIGITNNLAEIMQTFNIYGFINNFWEEFVRGKNYEAFLLTVKK